jgi:hypothetical protein
MRIGAERRVGLKNSRDCDDRILQRRNAVNRAAAAAPTSRFPRQINANQDPPPPMESEHRILDRAPHIGPQESDC